MTDLGTVKDQVAQFLGGTYRTETHDYRTAAVGGTNITGLALVRRGYAKHEDFADFFAGAAAGAETGAWMAVWIPDKIERRLTTPAVVGRKHVRYVVELHCYVWSKARYAEDCSDFIDALDKAIVARIRTDPTLGTGGFEVGQIQAGEPDEHGAGGEIHSYAWQNTTDDGVTKGKLEISFEAHAIDVG